MYIGMLGGEEGNREGKGEGDKLGEERHGLTNRSIESSIFAAKFTREDGEREKVRVECDKVKRCIYYASDASMKWIIYTCVMNKFP